MVCALDSGPRCPGLTFNSQDLISDSLCRLSHNPYDVNLETLVLLDSVSIM